MQIKEQMHNQQKELYRHAQNSVAGWIINFCIKTEIESTLLKDWIVERLSELICQDKEFNNYIQS